MNLHNYFTLLVAVHSCILGSANSQFRVIGGALSRIEATPHMVSIYYNKNYECAGSLISMDKVITSATCLRDRKAKYLEVKAGVTNIVTETGQTQSVKKTIFPKEYKPKENRYHMDIGGIKVSKSFTETPQVKPIDICTSELKPDKQMFISGWGSTNAFDRDYVPELLTKVVYIVDTQECANNYYEQRGITLTESMMCAGLSGCDAVKGDFGAPGVVDEELCGVVSFFWFIETPVVPVVYTNITNEKVRKFIQKVKNC